MAVGVSFTDNEVDMVIMMAIWIPGILWPEFSDIYLTVEGNPGKTSTRKFNPTRNRTRARCVRSSDATSTPQRWSINVLLHRLILNNALLYGFKKNKICSRQNNLKLNKLCLYSIQKNDISTGSPEKSIISCYSHVVFNCIKYCINPSQNVPLLSILSW